MSTTTTTMNETELKCANLDTMILPIFPFEETWSDGVRGFLYFLGLVYLFMGIAIVADVFMGSIEKITGKTKLVRLSKGNKEEGEEDVMVEVNTWNSTVANLTLMALGSSAPEILLSIIEIVKNGFEVGELGPGTIVGSAAFNLLVITGVCIIAIPHGEMRSIKMIKVFFVTGAFSLFAYVWFLIVLEYVSPNVVELWEAVVTFLLFPILVLVAWGTDRNWKFGKNHRYFPAEDQEDSAELGNSTDGLYQRKSMYDANGPLHKDSGLIEFYKVLRKYPHLTDSDAATLAAIKVIDGQPRSRLWYRIGAVRDLAGHRKIRPSTSGKLQAVFDTINARPGLSAIDEDLISIFPSKNISTDAPIQEKTTTKIEFPAASLAVRGNVGQFKVIVVRQGNLQGTVRVKVESMDGTAKQGMDYKSTNCELTFGPEENGQEFTVNIIDQNKFFQPVDVPSQENQSERSKEREFFLRLSIIDHHSGNHGNTDNNKATKKGSAEIPAVLGRLAIMEVVILDDGEPGVLSFQKPELLLKRSFGYATIQVERTNGADGEVAVKWRIISSNRNSFAGEETGNLIFKNGELVRTIKIPIDEDEPSVNERDERFDVELFDPSRGAKLGQITKISVHVSSDSDFDSVLQRWLSMTTENVRGAAVEAASWKSQMLDALTVNGGDVEGATGVDFLMHFLTFFWKVLFACTIPPAKVWGGWLAFVCSLGGIGVLTAVVVDMATIFGCVVGLKDTVTAITFVALGTSMPDLFASMTAAAKEKYGDNAIGNVTGSNSVNVFLGLGLPWIVAAIYHQANGQEFQVGLHGVQCPCLHGGGSVGHSRDIGETIHVNFWKCRIGWTNGTQVGLRNFHVSPMACLHCPLRHAIL